MKSQKMIEYEAWMEAWRREHPLPPMSKKARWRLAHATWLEWRRQVRKAEKEKAGSYVVNVPCVRER